MDCFNNKYKKIVLLFIAFINLLLGFIIGITNNKNPNAVIICLVLFITSFMIFIVIQVDQNDINTDNNVFNFKNYKKKYSRKKKGRIDDICSICIEEINKDYFYYKSCNHIYHDKCLIEWLKINKSCPNCRNVYP